MPYLKKQALGVFLDVVCAFDNVTFCGFVTSWIKNLLRHRTAQVELYGDKVKREVMKGNSQGGILSPFLWSCVSNRLLVELRSRSSYVLAYADDLAVLVIGADMLWIRGMAQKAISNPANWLWNKSYHLAARKPKLYCSLTNGIQIWVPCQ